MRQPETAIPAVAATTLRVIAALGLLIALALPARADAPMSGTFVANAACPAVSSIKKGTNAGNVTLTPQQGYAIVSANNTPASHYLVIVPGADPGRRWVAIGCGTVGGASADASSTQQTATPVPSPPASAPKGGPTHYVLAISWEPGFCAGARDKPECAAETPQSFEASHFVLHGLWPDPNEYCGVSPSDIAADKQSRWTDLPAVSLTSATRARLAAGMPGTQSDLERHEWLKHGTCTGAPADAYFGRELDFLDAVNASPVQALIASDVGGNLSLDALRTAFDQGFGPGAGQRIRLSCSRRGGQRLITEITIGLEGDVLGSASLPTLIAAASPTNGGCDTGVVAAPYGASAVQ
jgi:ribonuclease T2